MLAEALAISTAFLWALGSIFARKGLQSSNALTGAFVRVVVSIVIFWILTMLFVPFDLFKTEAIVYHGFAGVFGGFIALVVSLMAIKKVGVAVSSTIQSTCYSPSNSTSIGSELPHCLLPVPTNSTAHLPAAPGILL